MKISRRRDQPAEQPAVIYKTMGDEMHDFSFALDFALDAKKARTEQLAPLFFHDYRAQQTLPRSGLLEPYLGLPRVLWPPKEALGYSGCVGGLGGIHHPATPTRARRGST